MQVNLDEMTITLGNNTEEIYALAKKISTKNIAQAVDVLNETNRGLPRILRTRALRMVLNDFVKIAKELPITTELLHRLNWYMEYSDYQMNKFFFALSNSGDARFQENSCTEKYKINFWVLILVNAERLDLLESTIERLLNLEDSFTRFAEFNEVLNSCLYDFDGSFDVIPDKDYSRVMFKSSTVAELREVAAKYDINVPKRLNRAQLLEVIIQRLKEEDKYDEAVNAKIQDMKVVSLQRFAKDNDIKASTELRKDAVIDFILKAVENKLTSLKTLPKIDLIVLEEEQFEMRPEYIRDIDSRFFYEFDEDGEIVSMSDIEDLKGMIDQLKSEQEAEKERLNQLRQEASQTDDEVIPDIYAERVRELERQIEILNANQNNTEEVSDQYFTETTTVEEFAYDSNDNEAELAEIAAREAELAAREAELAREAENAAREAEFAAREAELASKEAELEREAEFAAREAELAAREAELAREAEFAAREAELAAREAELARENLNPQEDVQYVQEVVTVEEQNVYNQLYQMDQYGNTVDQYGNIINPDDQTYVDNNGNQQYYDSDIQSQQINSNDEQHDDYNPYLDVAPGTYAHDSGRVDEVSFITYDELEEFNKNVTYVDTPVYQEVEMQEVIVDGQLQEVIVDQPLKEVIVDQNGVQQEKKKLSSDFLNDENKIIEHQQAVIEEQRRLLDEQYLKSKEEAAINESTLSEEEKEKIQKEIQQNMLNQHQEYLEQLRALEEQQIELEKKQESIVIQEYTTIETEELDERKSRLSLIDEKINKLTSSDIPHEATINDSTVEHLNNMFETDEVLESVVEENENENQLVEPTHIIETKVVEPKVIEQKENVYLTDKQLKAKDEIDRLNNKKAKLESYKTMRDAKIVKKYRNQHIRNVIRNVLLILLFILIYLFVVVAGMYAFNENLIMFNLWSIDPNSSIGSFHETILDSISFGNFDKIYDIVGKIYTPFYNLIDKFINK